VRNCDLHDELATSVAKQLVPQDAKFGSTPTHIAAIKNRFLAENNQMHTFLCILPFLEHIKLIRFLH